jgi:hypothetical protein
MMWLHAEERKGTLASIGIGLDRRVICAGLPDLSRGGQKKTMQAFAQQDETDASLQ